MYMQYLCWLVVCTSNHSYFVTNVYMLSMNKIMILTLTLMNKMLKSTVIVLFS